MHSSKISSTTITLPQSLVDSATSVVRIYPPASAAGGIDGVLSSFNLRSGCYALFLPSPSPLGFPSILLPLALSVLNFPILLQEIPPLGRNTYTHCSTNL